MWLFGCHRPSAEHAAAAAEPASAGAAAGLGASGQPLTRTDILLEIARIPHAEVATRLGPHRIESRTLWKITPLGSAQGAAVPEVTPGFREGSPIQPYDGGAAWESSPATLEETRAIQVDGAGRLELQNLNDHGYGVEAVLEREALYLRMRHGPYIRHRPEGDEVERLRALAYEPGAALLETVAPSVSLGTPVETTRLGRPAWQVALSLQKPSARRPAPQSLSKAWRGEVAVSALDGYAVVDRQRGALLELRLTVRFTAPRGKAPPGTPPAESQSVQIDAQHELRVVALGAQVATIQPPTEWSEPPMRARPALEKQELLNGLIPARP